MEEITKELENYYDQVCAHSFATMWSCLTKSKKSISLLNFNPRNKEHKFLAYCAKSVAGVLNLSVYLDCGRLGLYSINKHIKDKECKFERFSKVDIDTTVVFNTEDLLNDFNDFGKEILGEDFSVEKIYDAYYNPKKGNK